MKRCPLCDFIYEDEQSLCDMDGYELVADSGLLSRLDNTTTVPANLPQPTSSWGRRLAFPTVATVILGAVLFLVYYVPTHLTVRQRNYSPTKVTTGSQPGQTLSPAVEAMTAASPTDSPQSSPSPESEKPNAQLKGNTSRSETLAPSASPSPAPKPAEKKHKIAIAQPVGANQKNRFKRQEHPEEKKDSKVASFLKKTGRILKKPFEF